MQKKSIRGTLFFVFLFLIALNTTMFATVFNYPVKGKIRYSSVPVEGGDPKNAPDDASTWYSMVWTGRYLEGCTSSPEKRAVGRGGHSGVDIRTKYLANDMGVYAIADGVVFRKIVWDQQKHWGNVIVIKHENVEQFDGIDTDGIIYSVYAHLDVFEPYIEQGIYVKRGDRIGTIGGTGGWSPHLHFQIDKDYLGTQIYPYFPSGYPTPNDCGLSPSQISAYINDVQEHTIDPIWLIERNLGYLFASTNVPGHVYMMRNGYPWRRITAIWGLGNAIFALEEYNGSLYAGTSSVASKGSVGGDGCVYRYEGQNIAGNYIWTQVGQNLDSQVTALENFKGRLYAGTSDNGRGPRLYVLDEMTGQWSNVWSMSFDYTGFYSSYTWGDNLLLGDLDNFLVGAYNSSEGYRLMVNTWGRPFDLELFKGNVYSGSRRGMILYTLDGAIDNWGISTLIGEDRNIKSLGNFGGRIYLGTDWAGIGLQETQLWRYDPEHAELAQVWASTAGGINEGVNCSELFANKLFFGTGEDAENHIGQGQGRVYSYDGVNVIDTSGILGIGIQALMAGNQTIISSKPQFCTLLTEIEQLLPLSLWQNIQFEVGTVSGSTSSDHIFFNSLIQNMRFIVNWGGSRLKANVYQPSGQFYGTYESDNPPIIIDIPDASPGDWKLEVFGLEIPYDDYPYVVSVGYQSVMDNEVPVALGQDITTKENTPKAIELVATEPEGDPLTYLVIESPLHGTLTGDLPYLTYTPELNYYGPDEFTFLANDGKADSNVATVSITVKRVFSFFGFDQPVDNQPIVNNAKGGSSIPVKWRITDLDGTPISDPASFVSLASYSVPCESFSGEPVDELEERATGGSGLQYLGDGYWQFNWKAAKGFAGQCRIMVLKLDDGSEHTAFFKFK